MLSLNKYMGAIVVAFIAIFASVAFAGEAGAPPVVAPAQGLATASAVEGHTSQVAQSEAPKKGTDAKDDVSDGKETAFKSKYFMLHNGIAALSPYKIKPIPDGASLGKTTGYTPDSSSGNDTAYFVEGVFRKRAAWLGKDWDKTSSKEFPIDQEFKFGLLSGQKSESMSSMAGSGDAYAEISLGFILDPLMYGKGESNRQELVAKLDSKELASTFNLELIGGISTARNFLKSNSYYGLGGAWVLGFPGDSGDKRVEMLFGIYHLFKFNVPDVHDGKVIPADGTTNMPTYKAVPAQALRCEVAYPFSDEGYFTFSGQLYNGADIMPWSMKFGFTLALEKAFAMIIDQNGSSKK